MTPRDLSRVPSTKLPPEPPKPPEPPGGTGRRLSEEVVELARSLPAGLHRVTVITGDGAIEVEWHTEYSNPTAPTRAAPGQGSEPAQEPELPADVTAVRAPLVGTFYVAPSPGAEPFVRVGDDVEPGQTLGIVEAMKLMNPIVAEEPGVVADVLAGNAQAVEFDQVLMYLRPAEDPE
jgi:acetyl-CoA carboxylase biotin carboxyl carrier protein